MAENRRHAPEEWNIRASEYAKTQNELKDLLRTGVKFRFVRVAEDVGRDFGEGWFDPFWGFRNNKLVGTYIVPEGNLKVFLEQHTPDQVFLTAKNLIREFKGQSAPFNHSPNLCCMIAHNEAFLYGESDYIRSDGTSDYDWQTIQSMAWKRLQKRSGMAH